MDKDLLDARQIKALRHLRNAIVHEGYSPSVRELAQVLGYKSPRTAFLLINSLIDRGWLERKANNDLQVKKDIPDARDHARTVNVALVGSVACGAPFLAEENVEAQIPVSSRVAKPGARYFLLRAVGDSMNRAGIDDNDLVLVRQQQDAKNGDRVVALINDEATIKELYRGKGVAVLKPKSTNELHKPIILHEDFIIQGVVISVLPSKLI